MAILNTSIYIIVVILLISITKRSQTPFRRWLPAAMAAPTPVSSLVHSRTLVTAGIYLRYRFNIPFNNKNVIAFLLFTSVLTRYIGSRSALKEQDLKKIIAFSTLRQLGLIFISFSSLFIGLIFFHLLSHAFFKSLMFIKVGMIIISSNSQIINQQKIDPLNKASVILLFIRVINLIRIIFIRGFYSKDFTVITSNTIYIFFVIVIMYVLSISLMYSIRLLRILIYSTNLIIKFNKISTRFNIKYFIGILLFGKL